MHVLLVYAHPEPTSFNAALKDEAVATIRAAGHSADVSDLFAEGFDPVAGRHDFRFVADESRFHYQAEQQFAAQTRSFNEEITREQARVEAADLFIFQFPLWWGGPPAILKGWIERVLAYGFAYVDGRRFDTGLFKGRRAIMSVTTGGTAERFSPQGAYGEIEKVLWSMQRLTLQYLGLTVEEPFVCYGAPRVDAAARKAHLEAWAERLRALLAKPVAAREGARPMPSAPQAAWSRPA
ncbi:MAG: NAD(P)H-dependent oxidoreductase [Hyphomicrobiales bacterium]